MKTISKVWKKNQTLLTENQLYCPSMNGYRIAIDFGWEFLSGIPLFNVNLIKLNRKYTIQLHENWKKKNTNLECGRMWQLNGVLLSTTLIGIHLIYNIMVKYVTVTKIKKLTWFCFSAKLRFVCSIAESVRKSRSVKHITHVNHNVSANQFDFDRTSCSIHNWIGQSFDVSATNG